MELDAEDAQRTASIARFLTSQGVVHEVLDAATVREREPEIAPSVRGALWTPEAPVRVRIALRRSESIPPSPPENR